MNISNELIHAIRSVWSQIVHDAMDVGVCDNEEALEMVLDANRLETFGHEEEDKELHELFKQHGHTEVFCELNERVQLL